jgi:multimeric flavodoxin WrbA
MQLLCPEIEEADGLILISPTHNYNVTAWMKAFIDRLYCFYIFNDERPRGSSSRLARQGRKAIIAAVGEQSTREDDIGFTLDAMRLPIEALGYEIIDELPVIGIFDKGKVKADTQLLDQARKMGEKLAKEIKS